MARDPASPVPVRAPEPARAGRYAGYIAQALATPGGHLDIGRGGATLHFGDGWLAGCLSDQIKAEALAARLPVIDSRDLAIEQVCGLVLGGPMVSVSRAPDAQPWNALSCAPLAVVADTYRAAGAEVRNLEPSDGGEAGHRGE